MEIAMAIIGALVFFGIFYLCGRLAILHGDSGMVMLSLAFVALPLLLTYIWMYATAFGDSASINSLAIVGGFLIGGMLSVLILELVENCSWRRGIATSIPLVLFIAFFVLRLMAVM